MFLADARSPLGFVVGLVSTSRADRGTSDLTFGYLLRRALAAIR